MSKANKTVEKVLNGNQDANISLNELCQMLTKLNFTGRIKGSHHNFRREGFDAINLQPDGGKAKPYQVQQVRQTLKKGGY